ncbi:MAG: VanZ family protein [Haloferacaceae archaeon]
MPSLPVPLLPRLVRWSGVFVCVAIISYFSILATVSSPGGDSPLWDKQLHFLAYAGLTVATAYATATWRRSTADRAIAVLVAVLGFGLVIELLQGAIPTRQFSPLDLVANVIGVALGSLWFLVERYVDYRPAPGEST